MKQIKHLVFDMGKVLVDFDPALVCKAFADSPQEQQLIQQALFTSPEWIFLDMGLITEEYALNQIYLRTPENLHSSIKNCLSHWHEYCMWKKEGMEALISHLKDNGYSLYLCSNAPSRLLKCYKEVIPGIQFFDGILFSSEVKYIKPQKEIYETLFSRFQLNPSNCYFIDDLQINIDAAKTCGMDGYCFNDGNIEALKKVLDKLP